jgi:AmmeMemoRadiSam system protein B/AmmeMemoRadiSam system protein A
MNMLGILMAILIGAFAPHTMLLGLQECNVTDVPAEADLPHVIREPAVAGQFYPSDSTQLESVISSYIEAATDSDTRRVRGLVSPHAGYVYSGPTAAYGYKQLIRDRDSYSTVIVMAPSHHARFSGASIANATHYRTPLGLIKVSPKAEQLRNEPMFGTLDAAHLKEHAVEVELPFLQHVLGDFELIPIVTGNADPRQLADVLKKYIDGETLVVASTDLSHYHPYDEAVALDSNCVRAIPGLNFTAMGVCECCGRIPTLALMYIAQDYGWEGKALDYRNSGDTAGTKDSVVGYLSAAFYGEDEGALSEDERQYLLELARETLEDYLEKGVKPAVEEGRLTPKLKKVQGCFTTLSKQGALRGCIGHILPQEELYKCVMDNAIAAALHDPRFAPVTSDEVDELEIEISALSVPETLEFDSPEDLLEKLRPGTDGVVIRYMGRTSTYLPQVWDMIPDKQQFLSQLCLKQGSPSNCWQMPGTEIQTYQAFVFHED